MECRGLRGRIHYEISWKNTSKCFGILLVSFSLGACSYVQGAAEYVQTSAGKIYSGAKQALMKESREADKENSVSTPEPLAQVVLRAAPRYLMVKPRTDSVWLWDRPGGFNGRAVRIKKVPSGTQGRVVEFEPEFNSHALWALFNFSNPARQPVRWMKVTTLLGAGWVRIEFVELQ